MCWFLPYINMDQSKVYIVPSLMSLPPTSHPIPPLQVVTEPWFEFPESYSKFPLSILHMLVYIKQWILKILFGPERLSL